MTPDHELHCARCGDGILYLQPDETLRSVMHHDTPRITDRVYSVNVVCAECGFINYVVRGHLQRPEAK